MGSAADEAALRDIYGRLDALYREANPVIPLTDRPDEFYEFNCSTWTSFPDETDPYARPGWTGPSIAWIFGIRKVGT